MLLRTLGGLSLERVTFTRRKPMLLLAYLALEGMRSRAHLAQLFWPDATDPANRLAVALMRLRHAAPDALSTPEDRVRTRLHTDVHLLREALERHDADAALERYPGAFLDGVVVRGVGQELEGWILDTREDLARRLRLLLVRAAEHDASDGRFRDAAARAERARLLAGAAPAPPELLTRMHALLTAGDESGADIVRREAAELGLTLTPGRARARASLRAARPSSTLPRAATSFVGRDEERLELGRVVGQRGRPLVTILGPGGIGKTRLALALAQDAHASGSYGGGVHFVPLEGVADPADVAGAIAAVLGVVPTGRTSPWDALVHGVGATDTLLVLDNVDDLVEGAVVLAELLAACPGITMIATSRRRLDIEEESVYPLTGLRFAPLDTEATARERALDAERLFLERAQRARLDYAPNDTERHAIRAICDLVEGSPLGIELAAVRVRDGTAVDAEAALRASFDALATPSRNVPDRHRTLRASFEASWADLPEAGRAALRRLAVFRGGFDADTAHDVCGVEAHTLSLLADRSLLSPSDETRYGTHPLIQAYALERLVQDRDLHADLRRRHADHFLGRARTWEGWFYGPAQAEAQTRFERERANLAAADAWALAHDPALAVELVDARWWYWRFTGRFAEGRDAAHAALRSADDGAGARKARALHVAGAMAYRLGDHAAARRELNAAREVAAQVRDDEVGLRAVQTLGNLAIEQLRLDEAEACFADALARARAQRNGGDACSALTGLGQVAGMRHDLDTAQSRFEEVLELGRRDGSATTIATSRFNLGQVARERGDLEQAAHHVEAALDAASDLGDRWGVGLALQQLGSLAYLGGSYDDASERYLEALRMYQEMGDARGVAEATFDLGLVARRTEQWAEAQRRYEDALARWLALGEESRTPDLLWGMATLATAGGRPERAAWLWGVEAAVRRSFDAALSGEERDVHAADVDETRTLLGAAAFARAWEAGQRATPRDVLAPSSATATRPEVR